MKTGENVITVVGDCPHTILRKTRIEGLENGELRNTSVSVGREQLSFPL